MRARFALALMAFIVPPLCAAAPPTHAELTKLCTNAEDQAHCGRLVEASRLPALKKFVTREGDELRIALVPAGLTVFRDAINIIGARTYAVWDYVEDVDAIVLFATDGDRTEFWLVHALAKFPGHVKNRDQLMGEAHVVVDDSTITSHIKRIRRKFGAIDAKFDCIDTVYGLGYRWKAAD